MRDFALSNGDLSIENGDLVLCDGIERVTQQINVKLKLWSGEWFLDYEFGTPYLQEVLVKGIPVNYAIESIKDSVLEIDGVDAIESVVYDFDESSRNLRLEMEISSKYGIIRVNL